MIILDIPRDFTSYEFYSNILPKIVMTEEKEIVMDMSITRRIEPLVIPNLLCCAYKMWMDSEKNFRMLIPDTVTGGMIRNYLNEIEFTKYAQRFSLYDFVYDPWSGLDGKQIDPICGTLIFNADDSRDEIYRGVIN